MELSTQSQLDVVSAAWYAAQNPFSSADVPTSTVVFNRMFDVWVRNSEPGYKAADRNEKIKDLVGDVVYGNVKVGDAVFVVEAVTRTHVRVRAVEVAEQTSDEADTYYSDVLVRNEVNVRKCCKDFIIRILFQAMWAHAFAEAGLELVAWPTPGMGLNAFIVGTIGKGAAATMIWLPTCIMHGHDAIKGSHSYAAPSGATLSGASSTITYSPEDKPNTFGCYFFGSGCGRPGVLLGLRDVMMGLASFALPTATTPFAMLNGSRKADDGRIVRKKVRDGGTECRPATLMLDDAGAMGQPPLVKALMKATRRDHGAAAGPLPYVLPGAADAIAVLRRAFEAVLLSLIVALLDAARPRGVAPAPALAPVQSDENDEPRRSRRLAGAPAPATTSSGPAPKRTRHTRGYSMGDGSNAAMAYTPAKATGVEAFVTRMERSLAGGGTIVPTFASELDVTYRPVELLEATPLSKEDMITAWTIAAQPGAARRNGTRPTFVLATSIGNTGRYVFYPSKSHYWLTNIQGTGVHKLEFIFEPVGVDIDKRIAKGSIPKPIRNVTKPRLDMMIGTSRAIEKDDDDSSGDSSDEDFADGRRPRYEKDQPAGAILKFVVNKYLEVYGTDNGRVA